MISFSGKPLSAALIHGITVTAGLLIYFLATRIGKQHRHPSVAISWVLTIIAFPYAGIPLFLLFGTRKFARPLPHAKLPVEDSLVSTAPVWATRLLKIMDIAPPTENISAQLHRNGSESWQALLNLFESAQQQLDVCTFILGGDEIGNKVTDRLIARANDGVTVRLLIDAIGSINTPHQQINKLKAAGVAVRYFMPILHNPTQGRTNLRIHRKLALADGQQLWSGGRNFAAEYFIDQPGQPAWIDLSFVITGPLAADAQTQFERDWAVADGQHKNPVTTKINSQLPTGDITAQWIPSGPDHADDTVYQLLLTAAYQAESQILAVTPYFVPNDTLLEAWCMACRRGVAITLIVPEVSNHRLADLARGQDLQALVEAGASVLLYPGMVHAKLVIVDNVLGLCGSVNLDGRSLFLNYEAMAAFYGSNEIAWLTAWHSELAQHAAAYQPPQPSWLRDLGEGIIRVVGFEL